MQGRARCESAVNGWSWVTPSPYRIGIPHPGHWHLAVTLGGAAGTISERRLLG
jgi:hypothetical protein